MKITAVLPAFNAAKTLRKTYDAIPKEAVHEIILVDDASTDATVEEASQISGLIVVVHEKNKGYGGNQKTCYDKSLERGADIVADFVLGSRFLQNDPRTGGMVWWRYWGNRLLTTLQNHMLKLHLSECHSGYRAYSRELLEKIPYHSFSDNFVFDSEMLKAIAQARFRIAEVPIPTRYTQESSSIPLSSSIRYGLATLWTLIV